MLNSAAFCSLQTEGELECIQIEHPKFNAQLCLQGAQLTQFNSNVSGPLLWLSPDAKFEQGKSVRGGIPICWPWFGAVEFNPDAVKRNIPVSQGAHGFARNMLWQLHYLKESAHDVCIGLKLSHNKQTLEKWPFEFELICHFQLSDNLKMQLECKNLSKKDLTLSQALHTYLPTPNIKNTLIQGAHNSLYIDALDGWRQKVQTGSVKFTEEVDRIYIGHKNYRVLREDKDLILNSNSHSSIIWNPWIKKSQWLSHYPDTGFESMLCIESANVLDDYISLAPGQTSQALSLELSAD
ncbi:MAG: D-hexose-6-phosphate mutarotase [Bermanella sp.]